MHNSGNTNIANLESDNRYGPVTSGVHSIDGVGTPISSIPVPNPNQSL